MLLVAFPTTLDVLGALRPAFRFSDSRCLEVLVVLRVFLAAESEACRGCRHCFAGGGGGGNDGGTEEGLRSSSPPAAAAPTVGLDANIIAEWQPVFLFDLHPCLEL